MSFLIVLAHPSDDSLTASVAKQMYKCLSNVNGLNSVDWLNLYDDAFDPAFSEMDWRAYRA